MNNIIYITNKTQKPMHATISDNNTGNNVLEYDLQPGTNEIAVHLLETGAYTICLADDHDVVFYQQKLIRD